jgi:transcriptional regulator with XRE-family HTH domain
MMRSELSKWLEKKYLEWQLENGMASISEFAEYLNMSQSYVSHIMNDVRNSIGLKTAVKIANKLGDDSIYKILGYEMPETQEDLIDSLPAALKSDLRSALLEIRETFKEREITSSSEGAEELAESILKKHGFKTNSNSNV